MTFEIKYDHSRNFGIKTLLRAFVLRAQLPYLRQQGQPLNPNIKPKP